MLEICCFLPSNSVSSYNKIPSSQHNTLARTNLFFLPSSAIEKLFWGQVRLSKSKYKCHSVSKTGDKIGYLCLLCVPAWFTSPSLHLCGKLTVNKSLRGSWI